MLLIMLYLWLFFLNFSNNLDLKHLLNKVNQNLFNQIQNIQRPPLICTFYQKEMPIVNLLLIGLKGA
jgi:hypothetical protein